MTVRYLEIFTEVCRHMSMSKAARALMISQSSVSQAVKALEQEYGVLLFERLNHTLYLTPAGEKLLYLATQVLKSIDKLNAAMLDAPQTLNIGSCNTVGASLLYPLIAGFKKQYPKVHVSAEISNTQTLTEKILNGRLDLAKSPKRGGRRSLITCRFLRTILRLSAIRHTRWLGRRCSLPPCSRRFLLGAKPAARPKRC